MKAKQFSVRLAVSSAAVLPMLLGCGAPVIAIAIWAGKIMLYTAAVQVTTKRIDQVLGEKSSTVSNSVIPNPGDPNRGKLPSLTVGRKNSDDTPAAGCEVFTEVPVIRSQNGKWVVEQYYTDSVIEPRIKPSKK
jgi:hypothetical protein